MKRGEEGAEGGEGKYEMMYYSFLAQQLLRCFLSLTLFFSATVKRVKNEQKKRREKHYQLQRLSLNFKYLLLQSTLSSNEEEKSFQIHTLRNHLTNSHVPTTNEYKMDVSNLQLGLAQ